MRILVCGGRDYEGKENKAKLFSTLDGLDATVIIHGAARGADYLADEWAICNDIEVERYAADWIKHGKSAGYIRNAQMLEEGKPDLVVAFPGGKGTAMMVRLAQKAGVTVMEIDRSN